MTTVSREDLVHFARRDWAAVGDAKTQQWLRRRQGMSPVEIWALSHDLWRHARTLKPAGPPLVDRLADLAVHHRVSQALRAVTQPGR